ncbi:rhamnogalacturonate lyase [Drechslerella dactyloides]|uniref:Rhamnogalacturonate lyase n=1 Tax=Drechslerella dactyloides TaxID=74499 RepID=A0AAD6NIN1_DREDA|nr:rhamnogalacturonate lyase [Drechslerella dactyloides]
MLRQDVTGENTSVPIARTRFQLRRSTASGTRPPTHRYNLRSLSGGKIDKSQPEANGASKVSGKNNTDPEAPAIVQTVDAMTDVIKALWLGDVDKRRGQNPNISACPGTSTPSGLATAPRNSTVRTTFLLVSDTHTIEPSLPHDVYSPFRTPFPRANVFIHAGDLTNRGTFKALKRAVSWITEIPAELKIIIAGNHDWRLDAAYWASATDSDVDGSDDERAERERESRQCKEYLTSDAMKKKGIWYLEDEVREFTLSNGARFTVLASPCTPRGVYPHDSGSFRYEPAAKHYWHAKFPLASLPEQVHVAITHTPPYKMHDQVSAGLNAGCPQLLRFLRDVRPQLSVCGHIHEAAGAKLVTWERLNDKGDRTALAERDLRPEIKKVETPEGGIFSDITGLTRGLMDGEQTLFVNASIAGSGGRAGRSPVMVELELPYHEVGEHESVGEIQRGTTAPLV